MSDPVTFDLDPPPVFRRVHVVLRLVLLVLISWIGHPFGLLWLGLPVIAAIFISQKGGQRYLDEDGPKLTGVLGWILAVLAYLALLTDRLPGGGSQPVRFEVERSGSPTVGSALLRILRQAPPRLARFPPASRARTAGTRPRCRLVVEGRRGAGAGLGERSPRLLP